MPKASIKSVLKALDNPKGLDLAKGSGYFYFIFDNPEANIFETESVYVCHMTHLDFESWVRTGRDFLAKMALR
jgi:hypothetical protein